MASNNKAKRIGTTRKAIEAKSVTLGELEDLCDDPARDLPGGVNVRALLTYDPDQGFFLSAQDGDVLLLVIDSAGKPVKFRTIEAALALLLGMSGLSPDIGLFQAGPRHRHH